MYSASLNATVEKYRASWQNWTESKLLKATARVKCCAWSPSGTEIATASNDGSVRVYDVSREKMLGDYVSNRGGALSVCWKPAGPVSGAASSSVQVLSAVGNNSELSVFDFRARAPASSDGGSCSRVASVPDIGLCTAVLWSARGSIICRDCEGIVRVVDERTWKVAKKITKYDIKDVAVDSTGSSLYCVTSKGTVVVLNAGSGFSQEEAETIHVSVKTVRCCSWLDGYLAIGGADHCFSLWDTHEWVCRASFGSQSASIRTVALGSCSELRSVGSEIPFSSLAVAAGNDEIVAEDKFYLDIGHVESGACLRKKVMPVATVHLSWSPTKPIIAWCGRDLEKVSLFAASSRQPAAGAPVGTLAPSGRR